jgi:hypothetical protein
MAVPWSKDDEKAKNAKPNNSRSLIQRLANLNSADFLLIFGMVRFGANRTRQQAGIA